jgi:hypothetical protein
MRHWAASLPHIAASRNEWWRFSEVAAGASKGGRRIDNPPVAVGTAVIRCPPHRPVLALLTHTVPTSETDTPKPFRLHVLPRHFSAPVFSGTVSSIGPCLGVSLADRLPSTGSADSPLPLFADLVGTMRSMGDSWLIAFSPRPANCPRAATGSPGSRAWSLFACLGPSTPQGRAALALACDALLPSADSEGCRSAFRTDVDHDSEVMPISVPN